MLVPYQRTFMRLLCSKELYSVGEGDCWPVGMGPRLKIVTKNKVKSQVEWD